MEWNKSKMLAIGMVAMMMLSCVGLIISDEETDAATTNSTLYGWGYNGSGQLGTGDTTTPVTTPVQIGAGLGQIVKLYTGIQSTAYFITEDGKLYGCGANSSGQLGTGDTTTPVTTPVQIGAGLGKIVDIHGKGLSGTGTMVFITEDGKLYGCGANANGQLGTGDTTTPVTTPVQIGAGLGKITAAFADTSSVAFITEDGKLYGCGTNSDGRMGTGSTSGNVTTPVQIGADLGNVIKIVSVGPMIFITEDGKLYGCGANTNGQLGNGTTSGNTRTPTQIGADLGTIVDAANQNSGTAFITSDNNLYVCGANTQGRFGNSNTTTPITTPTQIGANLGAITQISLTQTTFLMITSDNKLYGCGANTNGQMGTGDTTTPVTTPVQIGASLGAITHVYPTTGQTFFVTSGNELYGCGANTNGQMGAGDTTTPVTTPVQIGADLGKVNPDKIAVEYNYELAIFENTVYDISISVNEASYGSVSNSTLQPNEDATITISGNTLTIGTTTVTATPTANTAQYSYAFDGWTGATDGQTVTDGMTITANFSRTLNTYAVSVSDDGSGYGSVTGATFPNEPYGSRILIGGNTLTINGDTVTATPLENTEIYTYTFTGWFVNDVRLNNNETVAGNMDIIAKFDRTTVTYPITWVEDGKRTVENLEYGATPTRADPVKTGYHFTGWDPAIQTVTGPATYTAQFVEANFAVYMNDGNGSGGPAGLFFYSATDETHTFTIPDDAPTWIMHEFMGWSETNGGEVTYSTGDEITVNVDEPVTLYAVWERESGSGSVIGTMIDIIPLLIIVGLILGLVAAFLYFRTG